MPVVIGVPAETAAGEQSVGLMSDGTDTLDLEGRAAPACACAGLHSGLD